MGKFEILEGKLNQLVSTHKILSEDNTLIMARVKSQDKEILELNQIIAHLKEEKRNAIEKIEDLVGRIESFEIS